MPLAQQLQQLYACIKDHRDSHFRLLSQPFLHLPSRQVTHLPSIQTGHGLRSAGLVIRVGAPPVVSLCLYTARTCPEIVLKWLTVVAGRPQDYPDYYDIIRKPMDLLKIQQKLTSQQYQHVEDMASDCVQMFDNACRYNEPDSLIYKVLADSCAPQHVDDAYGRVCSYTSACVYDS